MFFLVDSLPYRQTNLSIIAAVSDNNIIGINNRLPWNIPEEMNHFTTTTRGHVIIMGRKTFESLGAPLPERINIILSRSMVIDTSKHRDEKIIISPTLDVALQISSQFINKKVFVIGGAELFRQAIPFSQTMIISRIHQQLAGDTFFPEFTSKDWQIISEHLHNNSVPFTITVYQRLTNS